MILDSAQHLPGEQLWWCIDEQAFLSPFHGELFDARGHAIEGPAVGDLDRLQVTPAADGTIHVDTRVIHRGSPRSPSEEAAGLLDDGVLAAYRDWALGTEGDFCLRRIPGKGNPHQ